jgi:sugar lactone lactonase YvrE
MMTISAPRPIRERARRSLRTLLVLPASLALVLMIALECSVPVSAQDGGYLPQRQLPITPERGVGIAVDAARDVFVADEDGKRVLELAAGSSTQREVPFQGLDSPEGIAVDARGDLFVADAGANHRVVARRAGSSTQETLPFGTLDEPRGVAVDAAGDVFVADGPTNRVLELRPGAQEATELTPFTGLVVQPGGVAADSRGDVFVSSQDTREVFELAAGSSTAERLPFQGLRAPLGNAVDARGDVIVVDNPNQDGNPGQFEARVVALLADRATQLNLPFTSLSSPLGVALDAAGDVFVTDGSRVWELPIAEVTVRTASLPAGTVGTPYSARLAAIGGQPPYRWSVIRGALPPGLSLDPATGSITGIPSAAGPATFTVQATDSSRGVGTPGSRQLTISIGGTGSKGTPGWPNTGSRVADHRTRLPDGIGPLPWSNV